jgi:hypothetical protein
MNPYFEAFNQGAVVFGIFDVAAKEWVLDCFDDPRLFLTHAHAQEYRKLCKDYSSARFEVRDFVRSR